MTKNRTHHINQTKTITFANILTLLMISATLIAMPVQPVEAKLAGKQPYSGPLKPGDIPDFTVTTTAYPNVRPSLV